MYNVKQKLRHLTDAKTSKHLNGERSTSKDEDANLGE